MRLAIMFRRTAIDYHVEGAILRGQYWNRGGRIN